MSHLPFSIIEIDYAYHNETTKLALLLINKCWEYIEEFNCKHS